MTRFGGGLLVACLLVGCVPAQRTGATCTWPPEPAESRGAATARHLHRDAERAEEIAIRVADQTRGPRSGNFTGFPAYVSTRDSCMTQLFSTIAASHAATQDSVRHELVRRPVDFDLGIMLSFAMLYLALVANTVAGRVRAEIPADERGRYRGASLAASVMVALGGVGLGELWVLRAEALRLGDEHLSGRTARIPWTQHRIALFLAFMLAYWGIAAIRNSRSSPRRASLYSS